MLCAFRTIGIDESVTLTVISRDFSCGFRTIFRMDFFLLYFSPYCVYSLGGNILYTCVAFEDLLKITTK